MTPYVVRRIVVPCPGGSPLQRIHDIRCKCGHGFKIDLGSKWRAGLVVRCPKCGRVVARASEDGEIVIL